MKRVYKSRHRKHRAGEPAIEIPACQSGHLDDTTEDLIKAIQELLKEDS